MRNPQALFFHVWYRFWNESNLPSITKFSYLRLVMKHPHFTFHIWFFWTRTQTLNCVNKYLLKFIFVVRLRENREYYVWLCCTVARCGQIYVFYQNTSNAFSRPARKRYYRDISIIKIRISNYTCMYSKHNKNLACVAVWYATPTCTRRRILFWEENVLHLGDCCKQKC